MFQGLPGMGGENGINAADRPARIAYLSVLL